MKKKIKIILLIGLSLFVVYFVYTVLFFALNSHTVELHNYKRYLWLFKDSVKSDVDTLFFCGQIRDQDIYYEYTLKKDLFVSIWEFKDLSSVSIDSIRINTNQYLGDINFDYSETFNPHDYPQIKSELGFRFSDYLSVNINEVSHITKQFHSTNYIGFIGNIQKLSLKNREGTDLILFEYPFSGTQSLFVFFKSKGSFFMVLINTRNIPFDEKILNLLNLP